MRCLLVWCVRWGNAKMFKVLIVDASSYPILVIGYVYTGINGESSFEASLLERAPGCEVWGYDFTVNSVGSLNLELFRCFDVQRGARKCSLVQRLNNRQS
jgi:hypothetical protein